MDRHRNNYGLYIYTVNIHTCSQLFLLIGPRSNETPGAISTPSTKILVSKYHLTMKETRAHWIKGCFQDWGKEDTRC